MAFQRKYYISGGEVMRHRFFGGIHPPDHKQYNLGKHEYISHVPRRVVLPMLQHIGVACQPLVKIGDYVRVGEKIGDGEGMCVPVHASVSGHVTSIEPHSHPNGRSIIAVEIENDFRDAQFSTSIPPVTSMSVDEKLALIHNAGIVGMGGAAFPSDRKALGAMGKIDTLIANACECEPYITADDVLLCTGSASVLRGIILLAEILQAKRVVLAIEDNKPLAIARLKEELSAFPRIELCVLPTRYPQGSEKQLIQSVTGRQVPGGKLPAQLGCAVFNVATCAAVERALKHGHALTRRIVSVAGDAIYRPQNFLVRVGTPICDLIETAGGIKGDNARIISGGSMMGTAQASMNAPVVKATNAILCLSEKEYAYKDLKQCIRCGRCVQACPMRLQPLYLYRAQRQNEVNQLQRFHLMDCIECGCCAYVCPAKLPLVECFRMGKQKLREVQL